MAAASIRDTTVKGDVHTQVLFFEAEAPLTIPISTNCEYQAPLPNAYPCSNSTQSISTYILLVFPSPWVLITFLGFLSYIIIVTYVSR